MANKFQENVKNGSLKADSPGDDIEAIENSLKELLDDILSFFERFIHTKEDLSSLENKLSDYESVINLIDVIKNVFQELTIKIDTELSTGGGENYEQLEKITQKYEGEIRNHIRVEQQLKLYAESLQTKLDDSEQARVDLLATTKTMINDIKRDNQKLAESVKNLREENERLMSKLKSFDDLTFQYESQVHSLQKLLHAKPGSSKGLIQPINSNNSIFNQKGLYMSKVGLEADHKNKSQLKGEGSVASNLHKTSTPLKIEPKNTPETRPSSAMKSKKSEDEYLKVKIEITKDKVKRDSYRTNSRDSGSNIRDRRQTSSVSKRDAMYSGYSGHNSSNNSLIASVNNSHHQLNNSGVHKRSKSISGAQKSKNSFSKGKIDISTVYPNNHHDSWLSGISGEQKSRYL